MKSLIAVAIASLAATTLLTSTAEAGMHIRLGFGGLPPYLTNYNKESAYEHRAARKHYRAASRHHKAPAREAKPSSVAKADDKVETKVETAPVKAAEMENSSISVAKADVNTASIESVETAVVTDGKPQTAHSIDCKKFFPTVGMTLSVPCE